MSSSFKQGFPERWHDVLKEFEKEASQELIIERRVLAYEEVLVRLAEQVSNDVRVVCGFHKAHVVETKVDGHICTAIHLPINPTADHAFLLIDNLKKIQEASKSSAWQKMESSYIWNDLQIRRLSAYLMHQYRDDAATIANAICAWTEIDTAEAQGWRLRLDKIPEYSDTQRGVAAINILFHCSPEKGPFDKIDTFSLGHFSGFLVRNRLMLHKTFEKSAAVVERLLATNEDVRKKALLLLQNFRHKPHDQLARIIACKGYETLLQMEAMTTYDIWEKLAREQMRSANIERKKCNGKSEKASTVQLREGDPDELRYLENDGERDVWRRAYAYISVHPPELRSPLRDVLPIEKYKYEMGNLRATFEWDALGAKEREVMNHIFSEVARISYEYAENEDRPFDEISFKTGTPAYAVNNRRLTCFTGPWLVAALCLECGIPYEKLYYCNVNNNHDNHTAGSHAALLMRYSDGTMGFIDYGYKKSSRSFSTQLIEKPADGKKLLLLFNTADSWAKENHKISGDPVHVSVDRDTAKKSSLYTDMHVLPLDQGFAATQLLHTGLSLRDLGKIEEALEAFELGLTLFPASPDLLCQCAIIHYENGDIERAEWLLDLALSEYANHLVSMFYKAKICHIQGRINEALALFNTIGLDDREVWGDTSVKAQANRYCIQHQIMTMTVAMPDILEALAQARSEASSTSILTRCEDYLL